MLLLSLIAAASVVAAEPQASPQPPAPSPDATAAPSPKATGVFAVAAPLAEQDLGRETAREDLAQIAQANQVAGVSHNSVNGNSVTGSVTFSDSAFQGIRGLSVVNANSGNNVAVNAAMNVNIYINPAQ